MIDDQRFEIQSAFDLLPHVVGCSWATIWFRLNKIKNTTREVSIDYIQKVVCDYFDLSIDILKSKTRKRNIVQARQLAMYFSKQLTKSSLANIGARCGGKDHATVLHACKTVNNLVDTDKDFRQYVQELEKKFTLP